jgi:hypothetical protein
LHFHNCIISRIRFSFSIIELYWTNLPMLETRGIPAQFGVNYVVWQTRSIWKTLNSLLALTSDWRTARWNLFFSSSRTHGCPYWHSELSENSPFCKEP